MGESRGSSIILLFPCAATGATFPKPHSAVLPTVVTWCGTCLKMALGVGGPFCWLHFLTACPVWLHFSKPYDRSLVYYIVHTHTHTFSSRPAFDPTRSSFATSSIPCSLHQFAASDHPHPTLPGYCTKQAYALGIQEPTPSKLPRVDGRLQADGYLWATLIVRNLPQVLESPRLFHCRFLMLSGA